MKQNFGKAAPITLLVVTAAACVIRFFQYVTILDFSSGFFTRGSEAAGLLVYIVLAVGFAAYAAICLMSRKKSPAAFGLSLTSLGDVARKALGVSYVAAGIIKVLGISFSDMNFLQIAGLVAAISLAAAGGIIIGGGKALKLSGHLNILTAIYFFFASAVVFNKDLIIANHSDKLIVLLALIASTMLWASLARFFADAEREKSRTRELLTAGAACALILLHALPKLLAYCFGGDAAAGMEGLNYDVCAGLLPSVCFIFVMFFAKKNETA